ncbi:MAG: RodZ domain-containing protein [Candidatus Omnitrophota bacterium]|nr:DUF4115 domain-containing protein [Candidatus Omnitrophota bacterium]MBU1929555.1 DUF4115 domain-containing protein [Candidatus Omnitrophota bacterium]MBU2035793.1 DUF4115 domain-containing protein [Candidatus Omnitrophota bacterium]MBU2221654.1 DUF4115 domain-containing protein [Candidatus Omnitrophota bacterium]
MEPRGARLKKIRLEKGLSLEEAHKKTKIHLNILQAIEEDSFINLNPVYIQGFLKIYCEFLGVSPEDYIREDKDKVAPAGLSKSKDEPRRSQSPKNLIPTAASLKLKKFFTFSLVILFIIFAIVLTRIFLSSHKFSFPKREARPANVVLSKKSTKPKPKPANVAQKSLSIPLPKVKKAEHSANAQKEGVSLVGVSLSVYAKEDCYIDVKLDGKLIFKNILKKDNRESWQAKEKIELSLGNAAGVDLEVNGKLMPPLGRRGQILKNILITKDTLDIPR